MKRILGRIRAALSWLVARESLPPAGVDNGSIAPPGSPSLARRILARESLEEPPPWPVAPGDPSRPPWSSLFERDTLPAPGPEPQSRLSLVRYILAPESLPPVRPKADESPNPARSEKP